MGETRNFLDKILKTAENFGNDIVKWADQTSKTILANDEDSYITLYNFVASYKKLYDEFKKEYEELEKINIGNENNIIELINGDTFRLLTIQLNEQEEDSIVPSSEFNRLSIMESKNDIISYFIGTNSKIKRLNVDEDILRGYLDLFSKYYPLFELYRDMKLGGCNNFNQNITFKINAKNDSLINGLDNIEIYMEQQVILGATYNMLIHMDLSKDIKIDYDKSIIKFIGAQVPTFLNDLYNLALNNTKIDRRNLRNYNLDKEEEKVKSL